MHPGMYVCTAAAVYRLFAFFIDCPLLVSVLMFLLFSQMKNLVRIKLENVQVIFVDPLPRSKRGIASKHTAQ